jgi:hypothetical protein
MAVQIGQRDIRSKNMIIVTKMETFEFPGTMAEVRESLSSLASFGADCIINDVAPSEIVRGVCFRKRSDGKEVWIGWSRQVEDLLCLPMGAFDAQVKEIDELYRTITMKNRKIDELKKELSDVKSAGFFQRLKWLFKGVRI